MTAKLEDRLATAPVRQPSRSRGGLRVVHVTTVPETLGFLAGQGAALAARGIEMHAVSSPGPALEAFGRREGVPVHAVPMSRRIAPREDLRALIALARLFRDLRPDIVHGHTPKGGLLAMLAAAAVGIRGRLYTLHGLPLETAAGIRRAILRTTERIAGALAQRVHAVSPSLRRRALAEGLFRPGKIRVLGAGTVNGVDSDFFAPGPEAREEGRAFRRAWGIPPSAPVVGFVGRVMGDKGVGDLVAAWTRWREEFPDLYLVVVGPMEPQDPIPETALRVLRSDRCVRLTGALGHPRAAYAAMDVVVLPTYREGFPQVPLEAAAMGLPVVTTRVTGAVDAVVDGVTGGLVPPRDSEALAEAVRRYLLDADLRRRHGEAGRERVRREFRPEKLQEATIAEYAQLVRRRGGTVGGPRRARPRPRPVERLLKWILDVAGALLGLVVFSPILGLTAAAVRWTLGAPVLFRQVRPGWRGRPFTLYKFRTMRPGSGPDAERVTPLGRVLRALSLDELPQLWNVLRGDMSLVGPRPLLMEYLGRYTPEQARRHEVPPGLTGWTQVNGRNGISWDEKFALDLWYVDHWSLALDLRILARTVGRVLARSGVDGPGNRTFPEFMNQGAFSGGGRR